MRISDWSSDVCSSDLLPLTHRDDASAVSFVAGQCKDLTDQDWSGLAGHGRPLVIYMGLATAPAIADHLIADGVSPALPVSVVQSGTTAEPLRPSTPLPYLRHPSTPHTAKTPTSTKR